MNKYRFYFDEKTGEYHLTERPVDFYFSPRVFAQKCFYKLNEQTQEPQLIFRAGVYDEVDGIAKLNQRNQTNQANNQRYPIVTDITPSQSTANFLKNLLFSQDGFLTGHLTYMHQSWQWAPQDKVFGDYLKKLADNNGMILDALGNIAVAFGGNPNFMTTNGKNWTPQYMIMTNNKQQFIKSAIAME